jgi:hypothetical protein
MNTLTLSKETPGQKDQKTQKDLNRTLFQKRQVPQDHGTKGSGHDKDWYDRGGNQRHRKGLVEVEKTEAKFDAYEHMSPSQLEKAATGVLRASGVELEAAYAENDLRDALDADIREQQEYDPNGLHVVGVDEQDESYLEGQAQLRAEIQGALGRGKAVQADPAYHYEQVEDSQLPDYLDGFHITDRP